MHQALDDLERFHSIVLQKSTTESQELALETARICKKISEESNQPDLNRRLKRLLKKKSSSLLYQPLLDIIPQINKNLCCPESLKDEKGRITDIFRMKAITLINSRSGLFPSTDHTFETIRKAPIYSIHSSKDLTEEISLLTLEQTFSPFPGETVIVRGLFKCGLPESFALTTQSVQTGFPYPSQHDGWTLSNSFIPQSLLRPEYCHELSLFLEKKEAVAENFLNKTPLFDKSRAIWQIKLDCSQQHKTEFISLHKMLAQAIIALAPKEFVPDDHVEVISSYFYSLETQKSPFITLANLYQHINAYYIEEPYTFLLNCWSNQTNEELFSECQKKRSKAATQIISNRVDEACLAIHDIEKSACVKAYIKLFGNIIGKSAIGIHLQYFSEILESAPPQLNNFQKRLQTAALMQQEAFFYELEHSSLTFPFSLLKKSIEEQISLFSMPEKLHPFCSKIEKYYVNRYLALKSSSK